MSNKNEVKRIREYLILLLDGNKNISSSFEENEYSRGYDEGYILALEHVLSYIDDEILRRD